jgi:zinc carboxypeptidase
MSVALCAIITSGVTADEAPQRPQCHNQSQLSKSLKSLRSQHSDLMRLSTLAKSHNNRDVFLVELASKGALDKQYRPAMLVVGDIEGSRLAGTEAALAFIEHICQQADTCEEIQALLNEKTIYVIPRLNPDASQSYFEKPLRKKNTNTTAYDADRDGFIDEDGADDLNNDALISWLRVEDAKGTFIPHPDDDRILIEADSIKGESGRWLYFPEGKDNDQDEKINEDAPGGVNFNQNFPYQYTFFNPEAGMYPLCEKESRALADFVLQHRNIGIVVTFSSEGALLKTPESGDSPGNRKPQTKLRKEDAKIYDYLGEQYREQIGVTKEIDSPQVKGSFSDWVYFHQGRLSLTTPIWNPEIALALKKEKPADKEKKEKDKDSESEESAKEEHKDHDNDKEHDSDKDKKAVSKEEGKDKEDGKNKEEKKKKEEKRGKTDLEYLKWIEKNAPDYFLPWQEIEHPDYPGQKAEIGGFSPFAKILPPQKILDDLTAKNAKYLVWLAQKMPSIKIHDIEVKHLGAGVYEMLVKITNNGYLPTVLTHGKRTNQVHPTRVQINIPKDKILSGKSIANLNPLAGNGGFQEGRVVFQASKNQKITVKVISALAGRDEQTITIGGKGE